jgi:aldose 1-epimerase
MNPSGEDYELRGEVDGQRVVVTIAQVAAALRSFSVDGVDIVPRYADGAIPSMGSGIVMVPWPNRVADGQWVAGGVTHQLDVSEVQKNNALHGLLRYTAYSVLGRDESSVTLGANIHAANGYPFVIETTVRYSLGPDGLTVRHTLRNHSDSPAPVALGTHPYFQIGDVPTEDLVLSSPASQVYIDNERSLPVRHETVSGGFDLRLGARVADLDLDNCFRDITQNDGGVVAALTAPDGRSVEVWADPDFAYLVLLTTHSFVDHTGHAVAAVAIEPQTAAVNAFNTGDGLRQLAPGEEWALSWGVRPKLRHSGGGA